MNRLLTVSGAANLLAISPWTVRAYIRQGKLFPVRIGRLVRFHEDELLRFVSQAGAHVSLSGDERSAQ